MSFMDILSRFPTEKEAVDFFVRVRYGDKIQCRHCGSTSVNSRKGRIKIYKCLSCGSSFSPFSGTVFERSTDVRKILYALYLLLNEREGISAEQLGREINVTTRTARRMLQKIGTALESGEE